MTLEGKYEQALVSMYIHKITVLPLPDHKRRFKEKNANYAEDVSISHNTKTDIVEVKFALTTGIGMIGRNACVKDLRVRPYESSIKSKWGRKNLLFGPKVLKEWVEEEYYYPRYREHRIRTHVSNVSVSFAEWST